MSVLEDVHIKNNVSVVDYALVSSDLFSLICEFAVLDFCELYSNVRCSIVLNLSFVDKRQTLNGLKLIMTVLMMAMSIKQTSSIQEDQHGLKYEKMSISLLLMLQE